MEKSNFENLKIWQESMFLVKDIYILTEAFPKEELYGLTSQIRRAAVSIPSNISEGAIKSSQKEFSRFLEIAIGSCAELKTQIYISKMIGYINDEAKIKINGKIDDIIKMTRALNKTIKKG